MKSIRKNYLYNAFFNAFKLVFPLITIPFVAKALGPEQLGTYLYVYSVVALFSLVSNLGIMNYGNKLIASNRDNPEKLSKAFISLYLVSLCMTIPALILYFVYCIFFVKDNQAIFLIQSLLLFSTLFDITWFYMGIEEFAIPIKRDTMVKAVTLAAILLLVNVSDGLVTYTIIMSVSALVSMLSIWVYIPRYISLVKIRFSDCMLHFKPLLVLFIPVAAVSIYTSLSIVLLGTLANNTEVGQFVTATRIIAIPLGFITAMGAVMLPRMSHIVSNNNVSKVNRYIKDSMAFVMFMTIPVSLGFIATSRSFMPLFLGNEFSQAGTLLAIIAPVIIFAAWANVLRTQYLIPQGRNKSYIISVVIGALISLGLNLLLIPKFKAYGAAVSMLLAEFSVMLYQSWALRNELRLRVYFRNALKVTYKSLAMFLAVVIIGLIVQPVYIRLGVQVLVGGLLYAFLNIEYLDQTIFNSKLKHPVWSRLVTIKSRLFIENNEISEYL